MVWQHNDRLHAKKAEKTVLLDDFDDKDMSVLTVDGMQCFDKGAMSSMACPIW
jgi:hypothetical protein